MLTAVAGSLALLEAIVDISNKVDITQLLALAKLATVITNVYTIFQL